MNTRLFILLISISVVLGFEYSGNISTTAIGNNNWDYKFTTCGVYDLLLWLGATVVAASVDVNTNSTYIGGELDIAVGAAYITYGSYPFCYFAYFEKSVSIGLGQGFATADVSEAAGYVGTAPLQLQEVDSNGKAVNTYDFVWTTALLSNKGFSWSISNYSQEKTDIQFVQYTGTSNYPSASTCTIILTYLTTTRAGLVSGEGVQDVPVVPNSIESLVAVNCPLSNSSNSFALVFAVATGAATLSASGQTVYDSNKQVYFSLSDTVTVKGSKQSVQISALVSSTFDTIGNGDCVTQVQGKYGASASINLRKVTFPAGVTEFTYDSAVGSGVPAQDSHSSLVSPLLSLVIVMAAVSALLF